MEISKEYLQTMKINEIAKLINSDWSKQGKGINYAAKPYLIAMRELENVSDMYGSDSAKSIILYFLSNASTWKGEVAKMVKLHLNKLVK